MINYSPWLNLVHGHSGVNTIWQRGGPFLSPTLLHLTFPTKLGCHTLVYSMNKAVVKTKGEGRAGLGYTQLYGLSSDLIHEANLSRIHSRKLPRLTNVLPLSHTKPSALLKNFKINISDKRVNKQKYIQNVWTDVSLFFRENCLDTYFGVMQFSLRLRHGTSKSHSEELRNTSLQNPQFYQNSNKS